MNNGENEVSSRKELVLKYLGPALVALVFVGLAWSSWRKWPDILIDFGRELYIPWRITQGEVLYRDLAYLNGPFSPYLNALWFWIFGPSFLTLALCNLFLLALLTGMIYNLVNKSCDSVTATITCLTFLGVFAFGHLIPIGNYNFVSPYSHEITHGIILFFIIVLLFSHLIKNFSFSAMFAIGILLGFIFLGKGEIFSAVVIAAGIGWILLSVEHNFRMRKNLLIGFILLLSFSVPLIISLAFFSSKMPLSQAVWGIGGTWSGLLTSRITDIEFYRRCLGLDHAGMNALNMAMQFVGVLLIVLSLVILIRREPTKWSLLIVGSFFFLMAFLIKKPFVLKGPPLPLFALSLSAILLYQCLGPHSDSKVIKNLVPLAMCSVFGLALLAKIFFKLTISPLWLCLGNARHPYACSGSCGPRP
jgi:hypothetical protein